MNAFPFHLLSHVLFAFSSYMLLQVRDWLFSCLLSLQASRALTPVGASGQSDNTCQGKFSSGKVLSHRRSIQCTFPLIKPFYPRHCSLFSPLHSATETRVQQDTFTSQLNRATEVAGLHKECACQLLITCHLWPMPCQFGWKGASACYLWGSAYFNSTNSRGLPNISMVSVPPS